MLVKRNIVERWYQRDSWVYKNFECLFRNKIWNKDVPRGFSVCPYFWLSIFSLLIFKPFVLFPMVYTIFPLMELMGKSASTFDQTLLSILKKLHLKPKGFQDSPGLGILITFILATFTYGVGFLFWEYIKYSLLWYDYATKDQLESNIGIFSFWSSQSLLLLVLIISLHKKITKTECKTWGYLLVWGFLFLISAFAFIPSVIVEAFSTVFYGIEFASKSVFNFVYVGLSMTVHFLWGVINVVPIQSFHIPLWGYFLGLVGITLLLHQINSRINTNTSITPTDSDYIKKQKEKNYNAWVKIFTRILNVDSYWRQMRFLNYNLETDIFDETNSKVLGKEILVDAIKKYFREYLKVLQCESPSINNDVWADLKHSYPETIFWIHFCLFESHNVKEIKFDSDNFNKVVKNLIHGKYSSDLDALAQFIVESKKRELEKIKAIKNTWSHRTCIKVTNSIIDTFSWGWNLVKFLWEETKTLFSYGWILIKSKKQGACPYLVFQDPQPKNEHFDKINV